MGLPAFERLLDPDGCRVGPQLAPHGHFVRSRSILIPCSPKRWKTDLFGAFLILGAASCLSRPSLAARSRSWRYHTSRSSGLAGSCLSSDMQERGCFSPQRESSSSRSFQRVQQSRRLTEPPLPFWTLCRRLRYSFVHLLYESFTDFSNPCLGLLLYQPAAPAIALASLLGIFLIDYTFARILKVRQVERKRKRRGGENEVVIRGGGEGEGGVGGTGLHFCSTDLPALSPSPIAKFVSISLYLYIAA